MQLWTKVHRDPILRGMTQDLQQKEEEFETIEATLPTLVPTQCLQWLRTIQALQLDIEDLQQKKKILGDCLKPWAVEALKLSQDVDVAIKQLNQTLESVTAATKSPISEKLVDIAQNASIQSEGVLPLLGEQLEY